MPVTADEVVIRDEVRAVVDLADRLKQGDQEILRLSLWEHLSHEEIGSVLNISPNAAKQKLYRDRKALVREYTRAPKKSAVSPTAQEGGEL